MRWHGIYARRTMVEGLGYDLASSFLVFFFLLAFLLYDMADVQTAFFTSFSSSPHSCIRHTGGYILLIYNEGDD
jgi:hypothetical protein